MACAKYFLSEAKPGLDAKQVKSFIIRALQEDVGSKDITTDVTIPKEVPIKARIIAREACILCGIQLAREVFKSVDPALKFTPLAKEGSRIRPQQPLAVISGAGASILTAERVALNILSFLCAVATKTDRFVRQIKPFKAKIIDTRKTLPGLRFLQKYAVRVGGGYNHRMRLDEMVLIKDNHQKIMGGRFKILNLPKGYKVEIEVQNLKEFIRALSFRPDVVMLDNMSIADIRKAVKIKTRLRANCQTCLSLLEASGGIHLANVKKYASTGVDLISIGELTDSVESVDISLDIC
jgi:nicotinate-nucleotide pyrophosphorylase (carboxylating)